MKRLGRLFTAQELDDLTAIKSHRWIDNYDCAVPMVRITPGTRDRLVATILHLRAVIRRQRGDARPHKPLPMRTRDFVNADEN